MEGFGLSWLSYGVGMPLGAHDVDEGKNEGQRNTYLQLLRLYIQIQVRILHVYQAICGGVTIAIVKSKHITGSCNLG